MTNMTSKERGITDYLSDDWSGKPPGGDNASGVTETPDYQFGVPYRQEMPCSEEWAGQGSENPGGGYGHSDEVKDVGVKGAHWDMSADQIAKGFEGPERYDSGQRDQDIPSNYTGPGYDRGAGSQTRYAEFSTEGKEFTGVGHTKSTPGAQQGDAGGSMSIKPGNIAD